MSDEILPGDVVQLKSGGPKMTVTSVGEDQFGVMSVWCEWFDEKNNPQTKTFNIIAVQKPEKPKPARRSVRIMKA